MEDSHTLYYAFGGILSALGQLALIIGCIVLVIKQKNIGTIIMLVASILSLLFMIASYAGNFIAGSYGTDLILTWSQIIAVVGPIPYILFAAGLLIHAIKYSSN
ncbi:hypothetical protein HME9304_00013 [Flagellimonas maritima]|uniref:Uncharacterized protein n=1 Tax=Flagellimonas maritima TaxID=1383885 RepID=A0A2Z4LMQ6_9FLAO|nr:hypothetical protein [Allomuricauda aurantiaca]AWX43026.1 hypothetical protein HME9304_00013 [Allomuricauda aurantiaca]